MGILISDVVGDVQIFERFGLEFLARWAHVLVGIAWIGLLYYFNFVQVPSFAQLEPGPRNAALDKLTWRALWWFRWAAAATLVFGVAILLLQRDYLDGSGILAFNSDYLKSPQGMSIASGMLLGVTMFANVWLVIWPNQKQVIANARNVLAGGEADPSAATAGRRALLASRVNAIFSFSMLFSMVGTAHFFNASEAWRSTPSGGERGGYWAIVLVSWAVLELSALGVIGGTTQNRTKWVFEDHRRAIGAGLVLLVVFYVAAEVLLKA